MKNLDLLLKAAETMVERGIELDMSIYRDSRQTDTKHPCGTTGCALGNMPFLGIKGLELTDSDKYQSRLTEKGVNWPAYCNRVFDISKSRCNSSKSSETWNFLFSSDWDDLPDDCNQAEEFLGRVKILIANGGAPTDWSYTSVEDNEWLF